MDDPGRRHTLPLLRWGVLAIGWILILAGTAALALYAVPGLQLTDPRLVLAASFIPYGAIAWLVAALMFAVAGRRHLRWVALAALACVAVQAVWARPYWPGEPTHADDDAVTVMSLNLRCDGVGLEELAAEVHRVRPDVLVLQGADAETRAYFAADGWPGAAPRSTFHPLQVDPTCGKAVISDHDVVDITTPADARPVVRVDLPGGPLVVIPVDTPTPLEGVDVWDGTLAEFQHTAANHMGEPTVMIGDFNAVREHLPIRRMLAAGLRDAAEQSGAGWRPTFPADRSHPPVVGIDHAFVSPGLRGLEVETFRAGINAHLGLTVRLART